MTNKIFLGFEPENLIRDISAGLLESAKERASDWVEYRTGINPSRAVADGLRTELYRWASNTMPGKFARSIGGYTSTEDVVLDDVYRALTDQVEYRAVSQNELRRLAGSKYPDNYISGLALNGRVYIDREVDRDPSMRRRVLAHELGELRTYRPDARNDEPEHVQIELDVARALEYWEKRGLPGARETRQAQIESIKEGASAGDEFHIAVAHELRV